VPFVSSCFRVNVEKKRKGKKGTRPPALRGGGREKKKKLVTDELEVLERLVNWGRGFAKLFPAQNERSRAGEEKKGNSSALEGREGGLDDLRHSSTSSWEGRGGLHSIRPTRGREKSEKQRRQTDVAMPLSSGEEGDCLFSS